MNSLTRALVPVIVPLTMLAAGCSAAGPGPAPAAAPVSRAAGQVPATAARPAVAAAPASQPAGADVYFAESQDPGGTTVRKPACRAGCPVSGDGTIVLWHMTWPVWNGTEAVGTGTERIESCDPDCASGRQYAVRVTVTFSQPVRDCAHGGVLLWTRASFDWPDGLPAALHGGNAPVNPWDFTQLRAQAAQSCG
ncbi:MAG TPA: hypothetical protein VKV38_02835 [Trebonia sp.]|jgi:hypothetical protein|nr:hypothetical protein [Trebonia sp.]